MIASKIISASLLLFTLVFLSSPSPSYSTAFIFDNSTTITTLCSDKSAPCTLTDRRLWGEGEHANTTQPVVIQEGDNVVIISTDDPIFIIINSSVNMTNLYIDVPEGELQVTYNYRDNEYGEGSNLRVFVDSLSVNVLNSSCVSSNVTISSNSIVAIGDFLFTGKQMVLQHISVLLVYSVLRSSSYVLLKDNSSFTGNFDLNQLDVMDNAKFSQPVDPDEYSLVHGIKTNGSALVECSKVGLTGWNNVFNSTLPVSINVLMINPDSSAYFMSGLSSSLISLSDNTYIEISKISLTSNIYAVGDNATVSVINSALDLKDCGKFPFVLMVTNCRFSAANPVSMLNVKILSVSSLLTFYGDAYVGNIIGDAKTDVIVEKPNYFFRDVNIEGTLFTTTRDSLNFDWTWHISLNFGKCNFVQYPTIDFNRNVTFICHDVSNEITFGYLGIQSGSFLHYGTANVEVSKMLCSSNAIIDNTVVLNGELSMQDDCFLKINGDLHFGNHSSVISPDLSLLLVSGDLYIGNDANLTYLSNRLPAIDIKHKYVIARARKIIGKFNTLLTTMSVNGFEINYSENEIYLAVPKSSDGLEWWVMLIIGVGVVGFVITAVIAVVISARRKRRMRLAGYIELY